MTEEELRIEATTTVQWECTPMIDRPTFINGYITGAEPREKRITELEKENAELKEKCETLEDMLDEGISYQKAIDYDGVVTSLLEQNYLFTKAKELIKDLTSSYGSTEVSEAQMCFKIKEAERFLSEVEK